jgi:ubiquinone/menaquinone biosynthesis C-methylase UbiE
MGSVFDELVESYPAWWIDALGEHNHIGGRESTAWLLERSGLKAGDRMLDAGAFVGAAARMAATEREARAVATDIGLDFLRVGHSMAGGDRVDWVLATNAKLPFADGSFASTWCLDSQISAKELTRVTAARGTLCLCCEVPTDGRGGVEAFIDEWQELGWELAAHKQLSLEATQTWRTAEMELVRQRPHFQERYGERGYLAQLDMVAELLRMYEYGQQGHGLFVFTRRE